MAVAVLMVHALVLPPLTPYRCVKVGNDRTGTPVAGLFDMFKESDEAKAAKEEAFKAQQEMLARRRNPEAMEQYLSEVDQRRAETSAADAELKALQRGSAAGDKLEEWKKLRKDGKVLGADVRSPARPLRSLRAPFFLSCGT